MNRSATADPLDSRTCVSLDLETTGLDPSADDIIEIGAVKFQASGADSLTVLDTMSTLVNPHRHIPSFVQELTGISDPDVQNAPVFAAVAEQLLDFVGSYPVVGHNIAFDVGFLRNKGLRIPGSTYDTFDLATILRPRLPGYSLSAVAESFGIASEQAHRAVHDARMAAGVFQQLLQQLLGLEPALLAEISRIADRSDWALKGLLKEAARERPTALSYAGEPGLEAIDLAAMLERLTSGPPMPRAGGRQAIPPGLMRDILGAGGPLARTIELYEPREEQMKMAEAVAQTFSEGGQLVAEAGTGTGKSLAYLVPAVVFARRNGERIVISTNTINLQEQLVGKDIPDAIRAVGDGDFGGEAGNDGEELRFSVLKGRGNYLCLRRWGLLNRAISLTQPEARTLIKTLLWLQETTTGDRSEINLNGPEVGVWGRISAAGFDDRSGPCPFARRGLCFYNHARSRAEAAHLVVVNHALLALDAKHGSLLPEHAHLIIDEAHNLEDVATSQFGLSFDDLEVDDFLKRIVGGKSVGGPGLLNTIRESVRLTDLGEAAKGVLSDRIDKLEGDAQNAKGRLRVVFELLGHVVADHALSSDYETRLLVSASIRAQPGWSQVEVVWEDMNIALERVSHGLSQLHRDLDQIKELLSGMAEDHQIELVAAVQRCEEFREGLASTIASPQRSDVYWLSIGNQDGRIGIHCAPLHVGARLKEQLFSHKETAVLTGATLSTEEHFEYFKDQLLLTPTNELLLGSPFEYPNLALLIVPKDIPEPNARGYQVALERSIIETVKAANGRTLVLFTSRSSLRTTRNAIRDELARDGISVLAQGINGTPRQVTATFRETPKAVLLGTGSFWEGVDIAGEALSVVVIARLPFNVPTDPIFAARSQQFDEPFAHYTVPQAVIRFKQGFGRLIRRKTDRGVCVVLDRRVLSKDYGTAFLESIPRTSRKSGGAAELPGLVAQWLNQAPLT